MKSMFERLRIGNGIVQLGLVINRRGDRKGRIVHKLGFDQRSEVLSGTVDVSDGSIGGIWGVSDVVGFHDP